MTDHAIRCQGMVKRFGSVTAVNGVDLTLSEGRFLALLGPSGCGKTTVLRLIGGFDVPDAGTVEIRGRTVVGQGVWVPPERRHVGIVFQDYAIFPHLDVARNVAYGLAKGPDRRARVEEVLSLVGLTGLGDRMPHELSGGQQQRVALARALAPRPAVILLDEPFSNLDRALRVEMRREVRHILRQEGATAILVSHDQDEAFVVADRVAVLCEGRLEQVDNPVGLYHLPGSRFVATFVGIADFLPVRATPDGLMSEVGTFPNPGLPVGGEAEMLVRPESVALAADGCPAVIEACEFHGAHNHYIVRLPSGRRLHSMQVGQPTLQCDTRTGVAVRPSHVVLFQGDALIAACCLVPGDCQCGGHTVYLALYRYAEGTAEYRCVEVQVPLGNALPGEALREGARPTRQLRTGGGRREEIVHRLTERRGVAWRCQPDVVAVP